MLTDSMRERVWAVAGSYYPEHDWAHGRSHIERVVGIALKIGKQEGADLDVIELAAILHDVFENKETHSNISCNIAASSITSRSAPSCFPIFNAIPTTRSM